MLTRTGENNNEKYIINGRIFHKSPKNLISDYRSKPLSEYLDFEMRNSAGDYALIENAGKDAVIITSPGFSGGYIQTINNISVGRTLHAVLSDLEREDISFSQKKLQFYIDHDQTDQLPHSTIFGQIYRLPPGAVMQISDSDIVRKYTYVQNGGYSNNSVGEALEQSVSTLAGEKKVTLMYSGGIDSTALYHSLKEELGEDRFRVVSIDIGPNTNSVSRAKTIGEQYDIPVESVNFGWPPTDSDTRKIINNALSRDLINPLNPHWALHAEKENQIAISGQNMDAMLTIDMHRPQITFLNHLLATKDTVGVIKQLLSNLQYTHMYENNEFLKNIYSIVVPKLLGGHLEGVSGRAGYYLGQLSTGHPNIVDEYRAVVQEELEYLSELIEVLDPQLVNYIKYQHNAAKIIGTFSSQGTQVHLPSMWGPVASYCLNKKKSITDAVSPKREIYDYVYNKSGLKHKEIQYQSSREYLSDIEDEKTYKRSMESPILQNNIEYFEVDESYILELMEDPPTNIKEEYRTAQQNIPKKITLSTISRYHRILNMEKILEKSIF